MLIAGQALAGISLIAFAWWWWLRGYLLLNRRSLVERALTFMFGRLQRLDTAMDRRKRRGEFASAWRKTTRAHQEQTADRERTLALARDSWAGMRRFSVGWNRWFLALIATIVGVQALIEAAGIGRW